MKMKIFEIFLAGIIPISLHLLLLAKAEVATLLYSRVVVGREGWEEMSLERREEAADTLIECGLTCSRRRLCNIFSYDDHQAVCSLAVVR